MKNRISFSLYHPVVLFLYFALEIIITMFVNSPVLLVLSFFGSLSFYLAIHQKPFLKELAYLLCLALVIIISNPLFSHNGVTVMFYIGDAAFTAEALLYGVNTAIMITSVILWFKCYNEIFSQDKAQYLFSRFMPKVSLIITMTLRFIPLYKKQLHSIHDTQKGMGLQSSKSILDKIREACAVFLSLITWSFENAVDTGLSMAARGYGNKGRTTFSLYKLKLCDIVFALASLVLFLIVFLGLFFMNDFVFYPTLSQPDFSLKAVMTYFAFAVFSFLPLSAELTERIKWNYYKSRI